MPAISAKAIGKTILFGEHAVVYGFPAIAFPISSIQVKVIVQPSIQNCQSTIRFRNPGWVEDVKLSDLTHENPIFSSLECLQQSLNVTLPAFILTISSTIPISAGLGSSASVAVAVIRAMSEFLGFALDKQAINEIAFLSEIKQHGSPSGIDNSVITFEKPIYFIKGQPIEYIGLPEEIILVLADSGERTPTKDAVHMVREKYLQIRKPTENILREIGTIAQKAKDALISGNIASVGKLMTENHHALRNLDVSTEKLDHLVTEALNAGALGAKVCGGGKGGFMVSLCDEERKDQVTKQLLQLSPMVFSSTIRKSFT